MLTNYLKIAVRNLMKNKLFTGLNLLGLALGIAVALLLLVYVQDEVSFDRFHTKVERIYRGVVDVTFGEVSESWATYPNIVGPTMKSEVAGVEEQMRMWEHNFGDPAFVSTGERKFVQKNFAWADSTIFKIFDLKLTDGNPATALNGPNKVILSKSVAEKYFPKQDPIGRLIKIDNSLELEITGVYADFPQNSTLDAEVIGSFPSMPWTVNDLSWSNSSFETFFLLSPGADPRVVEAQFNKIYEKNVPKQGRWMKYRLQAMTDAHLHSATIGHSYSDRTGDPQQVRILIILAIVILVIACINYMNLATARSQQRFREVGITKTVGATRLQLARRFYLETALMVAIALVLGVALMLGILPIFNDLAGKQFGVLDVLTPAVLLGLLAIGTIVTLIAGSYPALMLSSFNPKHLLQTAFRQKSSAGILRRSLVVVQFSASIILIICTVLFYQQLNFIQQRNLGYKPDQVVAINMAAAETGDQVNGFNNACKALSSVQEVTRAQTFPGQGGSGRSISPPNNKTQTIPVTTNHANAEILDVLDIKLLAGKSVPTTEKDPKDTTVQVVVNKFVADFLGYTPEEAIGKKAPSLFDNAEIVGVMDNFHFDNFHQPIGGYAFHNALTEPRTYTLIKLQTQDLPQSMKQIEALFNQSMPTSAFDYVFLDDHLDTLYRREQRTASVVMVFSCLAILIACLGLFGLAAFTAEQRTKEIGVRKVLGASIGSIVQLLSRDFLRLVLVSVLIASPVAWYFMNGWLKEFAYRIDIQWWVFVVAGAGAMLIAFLTVSMQSVRAATVDPVKSLRSE
ncbi:MAG: FtsX-like permease family protein [Haliscomenobacter sp.]|uniref:ABC transporter permease n=1 Tax=Haliscomenobacter sp. TaxID=2717303 RepID=UPI0029BC6428|nr:ABC transporter permease [Haliscomenobacter sp.]MDX2069062.1 FtsX-like permease family protein [Haliscomenobacter sp.]